MIFESRRKKIEDRLDEYVRMFSEVVDSFKTGIDLYMESGPSEKFDLYVDKTHRIESAMDDLRREVSYELYSRTLLPDSRGDILYMFGAAEKVPDSMENILFSLQCENICIPQELREDVKTMISDTGEALILAAVSFQAFFGRKTDIPAYAFKIGELESSCDRILRKTLKKLFSMDIDCGEKVLLKSFLESLERISDHTESFSDVLVISSVKGQI